MAERKSNNDFERRFFDQLDKNSERLEQKVDENTKTTEAGFRNIKGRLRKVEDQVFPKSEPQTITQLPSWWRDPQIIKLLTLIVGAVITLLVIFAGLRGIKLPHLFGVI